MKRELSMETQLDRLSAGQERMRERCYECALANTPPTVRVIQIRRSLTGRTDVASGVMEAPVPKTRKALYVFLHECAHFALDHRRRRPVHVQEHEAEEWAHLRMREAGIAVPRSMTARAKRYVALKIRRAERRGAKTIDRKASRYAGRKS
jgi:hypothetical protein